MTTSLRRFGTEIVRLVVWLVLQVGLAGACSEQTDIVGVLRNEEMCSDATTCLEQIQPPPALDCTAASSCSDARCADAAVCRLAPSPGMCSGRSCSALLDSAAFCRSGGVALALGDGCDSPTDNPRFRNALCTRSELTTQGELRIKGDVAVDGAQVNFGAPTMVEGTLRYSGSLEASTYAPAAFASLMAAPSCGQQPGVLLDISDAVQRRATDNDNANPQATAQLLAIEHFTTPTSISLPCGRYYVEAIDGLDALSIHAQGNVALFVGGSVQLQRGFQITADLGARVTLVVNGAFHVTGGFNLGDLATGRHVLVAAAQINLDGGNSTIGGDVYAPNDELLSVGTLDIHGAVFVNSGRLNNTTTIQYSDDAAEADGCGID